jgi:hypothetical protein
MTRASPSHHPRMTRASPSHHPRATKTRTARMTSRRNRHRATIRRCRPRRSTRPQRRRRSARPRRRRRNRTGTEPPVAYFDTLTRKFRFQVHSLCTNELGGFVPRLAIDVAHPSARLPHLACIEPNPPLQQRARQQPMSPLHLHPYPSLFCSAFPMPLSLSSPPSSGGSRIMLLAPCVSSIHSAFELAVTWTLIVRDVVRPFRD